MITLIHGDDIATSRRIFIDEVKKNSQHEIVRFDGKTITENEVFLACETQTLLASSKVIVIERFFSGVLSKERKNIISYLTGKMCPFDTILWEEKEIEKGTLKKLFPDATIFFAKPSQKIFSFLETIGGVPKSQMVLSFHALLTCEEAEFIYLMLLRQFRYLILSTDAKAARDSGLQQWQLSKLLRQAGKLGAAQLI